MYNQAFGDSFGLPALKFSCTVISLAQFAIIIVTSGKVTPILTVGLINGATTLITLVAIVLPFAGRIEEKSQLIKSKYKSARWQQQFKIMKSCKPLAINIGSLYPIKKITILSYFNLYLANFANILIAMKGFRL